VKEAWTRGRGGAGMGSQATRVVQESNRGHARGEGGRKEGEGRVLEAVSNQGDVRGQQWKEHKWRGCKRTRAGKARGTRVRWG
jgi:hypothetical protein